MSRDIGALGAELSKFSLRTATLVHLDWYTKDVNGVWASTPLYLTSAGQNIQVGGITYQALGNLAGITGAEEGFDLSSYSMDLTLSGIPTEFLTQVFNDISFANAYSNRPTFVYIAFLDDEYKVIDVPVLIFAGQMDSAAVEIGETITVKISVHSRLINWEIPRGGRFNSETQKVRFPGDTGYDFIPTLMNKEIVWGGQIYSTGTTLPHSIPRLIRSNPFPFEAEEEEEIVPIFPV